MNTPASDRDSLLKQYQEKLPRFDQLGKNLLTVLGTVLARSGVELYSLSYRIKDFNSFSDKVEREKLTDPFTQCEDICGLRIIHYYKSDIPAIAAVIAQITDILKGEDPSTILQTDRFGFRSLQYTVKLKPELLSTPPFAGMEGLQAEIQIRTAVMETWANIMGKLVYEKKEHIPLDFQRKFYQLNTFFDLADDLFDELKRDQKSYAQNLAEQAKSSGEFDPALPMNLDNLQAFLDIHFPQRKKNLKVVSWLLVNVILQHNIGMNELLKAYEIVKPHLPEIEKGLSDLLRETYFFKEKEFEQTQGIMLMTLLSLTSEDYWLIISNLFDERHWEKLLQFFHQWRRKLTAHSS